MAHQSRGQISIGMAGWTYIPWRGVFFPKGWPQKRELEYASRQVNSIEINGTFYSLHKPQSFNAWHDATPDDFIFSVKAPKYITHIQRLDDVDIPVANFFASGLLALKAKLGPILWQLPPSFRFDREKMETFLKLLPHDTTEACEVAKNHDDKVKGKALLETDTKRLVRHCIEIRHKSFQCEEFVELLRTYNVALVVADTAGKWPYMEDVTSDFVYLRLHGDEKLYVSGYTDSALEEWGRKIRSWSEGHVPTETKLTAPRAKQSTTGRDVFVYFDNDLKVRAPYDAMTLAYNLDLSDEPPDISEISSKDKAHRQWPPVQQLWKSH